MRDRKWTRSRVNGVAVAAGDLARLLAVTLPATADPEMCMPELAAVHLAAGGGVLTATATDRYVAVHARARLATGVLDPVLLVADDARELRKYLRDVDPQSAMTLTRRSDRSLLVEGAGETDAVCGCVAADKHSGWPHQALVRQFGRPPIRAVAAPMCLSVPVLSTVALVLRRASAGGRIYPVWHATVPDDDSRTRVRPWRIDVDDWLALLAMPSTSALDVTHLPPVPYGLATS